MKSDVTSGILLPKVISDMLGSLRTAKEHSAFDATALRMRSAPAREVLAWHASNGRVGLGTVLSVAHAVGEGSKPDAIQEFRRFSPKVVARLARLYAVQDIFAGDLHDAHMLYQALLSVHGHRSIPLRHLNLAIQVAICVGDDAAATALLDHLPKHSDERRLALCDLANPFHDGPHSSMDRWLTRVNEILRTNDVPPIWIGPERDPAPFDGLGCDIESATVEGPLVTVAMSCWRPDATLLSAMGSLVRQTWRNLEILLVDDGSPAEFDPLLEAAVALDPQRIRLIRQQSNGGTYVIRNRALKEAKGAYFTVHDSDDWAHPCRIERQVMQLLQDERLVGNYCTGLRADDRLLIALPGVPATRSNESSLLFERERVLARIGYYDASRKGADTEYSIRLRLAFGSESLALLPDILSIIRLSRESLSRADFRPGWRHPARTAYRRGFEAWHDRTSDISIPLPDPARETFARPRRFQPVRSEPGAFDAIYLADFRHSAPFSEQMAEELALLSQAGWKLAIIQQDSFAHLATLVAEAYPVQLQELILHRAVEEVDLTMGVATDLLIIGQPDLLSYMNPTRAGIEARSVLVLGRSAIGATPGFLYQPGLCESACRNLFGVDPLWIATELAKDMPRRSAGRRRWVDQLWPQALSMQRWQAPSRTSADTRDLVIGMALPTDADSTTSAIQLMADLHQTPLRVWLETGCCPALPERWVTYTPQIAAKPTYFALLDFWVSLEPPSGEGELPPLDVLRAMAAGCIPVLHPAWRLQFSDAAAYAVPGDVLQTVLAVAHDAPAHRRLRELAPAFVGGRAGVNAFSRSLHEYKNYRN